MNIQGWWFSKHAQRRMEEMRIKPSEVMAVLDKPKITRPGGPGHSPELSLRQNGRLGVVVNARQRAVVTVLWWTTLDYAREGVKQ